MVGTFGLDEHERKNNVRKKSLTLSKEEEAFLLFDWLEKYENVKFCTFRTTR